ILPGAPGRPVGGHAAPRGRPGAAASTRLAATATLAAEASSTQARRVSAAVGYGTGWASRPGTWWQGPICARMTLSYHGCKMVDIVPASRDNFCQPGPN